MEHFDDHFLNDSPLGVNFDEGRKFFDPEAAQEDSLDRYAIVRNDLHGLILGFAAFNEREICGGVTELALARGAEPVGMAARVGTISATNG